MELKDQVVSLELAKQLKGLGVKQESYFSWLCCWGGLPSIVPTNHALRVRESHKDGETSDKQIEELCSVYSAFTVAELGDILKMVEYDSHGFPSLMIFHSMPIADQWNVCYRNPPIDWVKKGSQTAGTDKSLADAMAKMLIHLIQTNHYDVRGKG